MYDSEGNLIGRYDPNEVQVLIRASQKAQDYAYKSGATIAVAGGNDYINVNGSTVVLPADLNNVIAVSAIAPHGILLRS